MDGYPARMPDQFSVSLLPIIQTRHPGVQYGFPRLSVDFRVEHGEPVPVTFTLLDISETDWLPAGADKETWVRFASDLHERLYGGPVHGEQSLRSHVHPNDVLINWAAHWNGRALPPELQASLWIRKHGGTWSIFSQRGATAAEARDILKGLNSRRFSVTALEAMAIACRNWSAARPDHLQGVGIWGASFVLFGRGIGEPIIGAINRGPFHVDPETSARLSGEGAIGAWVISLNGPDWLDGVTVWVTADTGRVAMMYGPQGLTR